MNRGIARAAAAAGLLLMWVSAAAIEGLPGSTWGEATRDAANFEGWGSQGFVTQGIDWFKLPRENYFNTYASVSWLLRTNNTLYYNDWYPAGGVEVRGSFYRAGFDFSHNQYIDLGQAENQGQMYFKWYKDWNLATFLGCHQLLGIPVKGFPGDTWGELTHAFDRFDGSGTQGHLRQGVTWTVLPRNVAVSNFVEYRWRFREFNNIYYDADGPALGLEFSRSPWRLGVQYYWENYPQLGQTNKTFFFVFGWYYDWNLLKGR